MEKRKKQKKPPAKVEVKKVIPSAPKCITQKGSKVVLIIEAKPGSKSDAINELCEEFIVVSVQAEAKGGEANVNLVQYIAEVLGVKKTSVNIDKGSKSKSKLVEVDGISAEEAYERFKAHLVTKH